MTMQAGVLGGNDQEASLTASTRAAVRLLLFTGSPPNIASAASAVVMPVAPWRVLVDAVLRRWPMAHGSEEGQEVVAPMFADGNAAAPVEREVVHVRVRAARNHSPPRLVLDGRAQAVLPESGGAEVIAMAPTADYEAAPKVAPVLNRLLAAIAATQPARLAAVVDGHLGQYFQSSESLAKKINLVVHRSISFGVMPRVVRRYAAALSYLHFSAYVRGAK